MAANVKNVIVGAAQIFTSTGTGASRPRTTVDSSGLNWSTQSAAGYLTSTGQAANWRELGYTTSGLEVSYEPGYGEVMVDQLLDAARLFKQTVKVMLKTELSEGTLENIHLVFGQADKVNTYSGTTGSEVTVFNAGTSADAAAKNASLNISGGALGEAPVERSIVAIGQAPGNIGTAASAVDVSAVKKKERVYIARRVVQVEVSSHGLKRDTATVFPVQFRCLPDDNDLYDGAEYGVIIDRVYSTL
jgi:hypothetical protein